MGALQKILFWFIGIVAVLVIIGLFLPATAHVERKATIAADPETVFGYLNDLSEFHRWSPWSELDPDADYQFTGPEAGVGNKMTWSSEQGNVGSGSQEIVESVENQKVTTSLQFQGQGGGMASWELEGDDETTTVTWNFDTELSLNPVERYFGLMMDNMIGPQYEKGLSKLKELVEQEHAE